MNPGLSALMLSVAVANAAETDFRLIEHEVHPQLVEHCYSCHSVAEKIKGDDYNENDQWGYKPQNPSTATQVHDIHAILLHQLGIDRRSGARILRHSFLK